MNFKKQMKYVKLKDILHIFVMISALPFAFIFKLFNWDYWLVSENSDEARDNGYWFFKYVRENHPKQKIAYAIKKKSPDFKKVKALGKVIPYGGFIHWIYYLASSKKISPHKGSSKPNAAVCYLLENLGFMRNKRYFLQHGVIINNIESLYYKNCRFRMFVTSSVDEHKYIQDHFGYPKSSVKRLGLCRFDNLIDTKPNEKQILFMPSWRNWIARPYKGAEKLDDYKHFKNTEYFIKINEFLTSQTLAEILKKYNKELIFYPHRGMQKFIDHFKIDDERIKVALKTEYDIQRLLIESSLLITDYSSVFMDFAYMKKPVIFYQFDEQKFREGQYEQGYFDYHSNPIGKWCDSVELLCENIEKSILNNFHISCEAEREIDRIFPDRDRNNCRRNYEAILKG